MFATWYGSVQINMQLTYLFLKLNAIVLLVFNQKQAALT
jgi:hypothetical protein